MERIGDVYVSAARRLIRVTHLLTPAELSHVDV